MLYNRVAAVQYAQKWAKSFNPDYVQFPNDCTNFVSQALRAGGWEMVGADVTDTFSDSKWWYGLSSITQASHTWAGAANLAPASSN